MVVVIYIISIVVVLLGIMLWSTNEVFGDAINDLKDLVNDYNEVTIRKIKTLENEIKTLKDEQKQKETQEF